MSEDDFNADLERRVKLTYDEIESNNSSKGEFRMERIKQVILLQRLFNYGETFTMYDENSNKFIFNEMAYVCEKYLYDLQRHNYLNGVNIRE